MSTTETPSRPTGDMTAEDHIREARRYTAAAEVLADATSYERICRRTNDLQAAQVHATLAQTLKASELMPIMAALVESIAPAVPPSTAEPGSPAGEEACCTGCGPGCACGGSPHEDRS